MAVVVRLAMIRNRLGWHPALILLYATRTSRPVPARSSSHLVDYIRCAFICSGCRYINNLHVDSDAV